MAVIGLRRFRRKNILVALLVVFLFFFSYLLFSLPPKGGLMSFPGQRDTELKQHMFRYVSRTYFTTTLKWKDRPEQTNSVITAKRFLLPNDNIKQNVIVRYVHQNKSNITKDSAPSKTNAHVLDNSRLIKNETYELGVKLQNKNVQSGEKLKNKTLEHLAVIDISAPKHLSQLVFVKQKWNITVSFEDIGDIMKETQFLNKVDVLDLNGPILVSSQNRTTNFTYNMPLKFGFCDCYERYCFCCSKITYKRLHLNSTACSNFTFVSKTHELDLQFSLDGKPVHKALISADKSPLMCFGSVPMMADICVHFFNMTFRVNEHNAHQTQLLGCTDLSLNLYNKTIGAFPVDCFQIPGDPNRMHKERKYHMMPNWMP